MTPEKQKMNDNISKLYVIIKKAKEKLKENQEKFESIMETLKKWNIEMAENEEELKKYEEKVSKLTEEFNIDIN